MLLQHCRAPVAAFDVRVILLTCTLSTSFRFLSVSEG